MSPPVPDQPAAAAPADVRELAGRVAARQAKDFAAADALRDQIRELGWIVTDAPGGYALSPAAGPTAEAGDAGGRVPDTGRYQVLSGPDAIPAAVPASGAGRLATVGLLIEGWPDDLRECAAAVLAHGPAS